MRKFRITDEDGKDYTVEEMIEEKTNDDEPAETVAALTDDEIKTLRSLIKNAPKLLELLAVEEKEHKENPELIDEDKDDDDEIIDDADEDEEEIDEDEEEVIETKDCGTMPRHDSKKSFGSIEKKTKQLDDSLNNEDIDVAWAKRYNGGRE